eukprot:359776-Chlamydomonas_euryale.AAC.3
MSPYPARHADMPYPCRSRLRGSSIRPMTHCRQKRAQRQSVGGRGIGAWARRVDDGWRCGKGMLVSRHVLQKGGRWVAVWEGDAGFPACVEEGVKSGKRRGRRMILPHGNGQTEGRMHGEIQAHWSRQGRVVPFAANVSNHLAWCRLPRTSASVPLSLFAGWTTTLPEHKGRPPGTYPLLQRNQHLHFHTLRSDVRSAAPGITRHGTLGTSSSPMYMTTLMQRRGPAAALDAFVVDTRTAQSPPRPVSLLDALLSCEEGPTW